MTGLRADLPIGAMAAFGCLRVSQRVDGLRGARLGWEPAGGSYTAWLRVPAEVSQDDLVAALILDAGGVAERHELRWRAKLKALEPAEFRGAAKQVLGESSAQSRATADWFAAFGSESALDREGRVEVTRLDMTGGPQEFLASVVELAGKLGGSASGRRASKKPEAAFREALFGPWRYEDDQHSLGWDPSTIKLGAFTHKAPTKMANAGVMAAVWLAFESIPLFPCFTVGKRLGLRSFAFQREQRDFAFAWPAWREPIGVDTLGFLLGLDYSDVACLAGRGVVAVYRSQRFHLNKYYASFRMPELVFGGVAAAAR